MMKFKGKEYPVSKIECYLDDGYCEQMKIIGKKLKLQTTQEVLGAAINNLYKLIQAIEQQELNQKLEIGLQQSAEGKIIQIDPSRYRTNEDSKPKT